MFPYRISLVFIVLKQKKKIWISKSFSFAYSLRIYPPLLWWFYVHLGYYGDFTTIFITTFSSVFHQRTESTLYLLKSTWILPIKTFAQFYQKHSGLIFYKAKKWQRKDELEADSDCSQLRRQVAIFPPISAVMWSR